MKNDVIREFKVEKVFYDELSPAEKKILPILIKVCRIVASIYKKQEYNHEKYPGASLYPYNLSDREIKLATKKNPAILSSFTVVEMFQHQLKVTPYHIKYQSELQRISKLLERASTISKNKEFARYLMVAHQALLSGDYKAMDLAWLATNDSTLQFLIGPYERNLDTRFHLKMAYIAVVGIKDRVYTKKAERVRDVLLTTIGDVPKRQPSPTKVKISTIHNIVYSGFFAHALTSIKHIPQDDQTIKEGGSTLLGFLSTMDFKFDNLLYPIFNRIFETRFKKSYTQDLLRHANYYLMLVYGFSRQLHRYEKLNERLRELSPVINEINSMVSGIQSCKHLIMKGVIDQKELEAMIIMHICWGFAEWVFVKKSNIRNNYLRGEALALNFYFQNEGLRELNGISWPNFSKIFFIIENLSTILVRLLVEGSYADADRFIRKNLSYEIFKNFDAKLSKLSSKFNI